ncbi:hypothetical protein ACFRCG_17845 [Embleya sp. NPDC056575]|uniref:hypothetical protein n=1 Tax=unclassified Embleya TaxID=2699296 RepID=UPI003685F5AE
MPVSDAIDPAPAPAPAVAVPATAILGLGRKPPTLPTPPASPAAFVFVASLFRIRASFFIGP